MSTNINATAMLFFHIRMPLQAETKLWSIICLKKIAFVLFEVAIMLQVEARNFFLSLYCSI